MSKKYTEINARFIDRWVDEGWEWGQPIRHEAYEKAMELFSLMIRFNCPFHHHGTSVFSIHLNLALQLSLLILKLLWML